ncbi:MAG: hypothetical protein CR986_01815 [Ignavibacteriae bacterium]|nr:MAG: hypothetical protein CR986_01815 [Ignavibacteriota bacterium]
MANNLDSEYFALFAGLSHEIIFRLDKSGKFIFINDFGMKELKFSKDELLSKHFLDIVSNQSKLKAGEVFQKIIAEKNKVDFEIEIIPKVSIEKLYQFTILPLIKDDNLIELLGIGKDKTEHNLLIKKSEDLSSQLKEANRINHIERDRAKQQISILNELNTLKNEFISNVSHELRTPLASIIGFSETILDDNNLTKESIKEFNDVILTESKRLAKLINDVLDFSELESEKRNLAKESVNLIEVLKECAVKYEKELSKKEIIFTCNLPESELIIYADPVRIKKVFDYILSNSVKFTNKNGRVIVLLHEFLKEVEVIISDTGIGIPQEKLPDLFDKFNKIKTNNLPGTGFGLVTVKQIVDLHKGLITVKSEVDKGTSFIVRLPKYNLT